MYYTWTNQKDFDKKLTNITEATESYGLVSKGSNYYGLSRTPQTTGDLTVRSNFNRSDYNYYRSSEIVPTDIEASIELCNRAYERVSIVHSVIDMMADFTVQGIRIEHRNKQIQNFLNQWANLVDFEGVSERISNYLYRIANCPIKITYGQVPIRVEREWKSVADVEMTKEKVVKRRIPLRYNFLHPLTLEVIGGELSAFLGKPVYGLKVSNSLKMDITRLQKIRQESDDFLKQKDVPDYLRAKFIANTQYIPLDPDKLEVLFYKKDDWLKWSRPMIYSILDAIFTLEKMHLADNKALDGVISQVRLWTLGDFEHKLLAQPDAINKLRNILANVGSGDKMDIVWGPELKFQESNSNAYNFLTAKKYEQIMTEIYAGLGVPPSLTGVSSSGHGLTSNALSMKTMIERLEYGRRILRKFWEGQLKILQKAFGWRYMPVVSFDYKVLSDEQVEQKLLLDLWDRDILSTEKIIELCRQNPMLEEIRIKREKNKIEKGIKPIKASPYHNPNLDSELKKIIMQSGGVAPSELGIELQERKNGEKSAKELDAKLAPKPVPGVSVRVGGKPKGKPGQGRPVGKKDSIKRKKKPKPRKAAAFISLFNWANDAQELINDALTPFILDHYNKKNLRFLTKAEVEDFEKLKFGLLTNLIPYSEISTESLSSISSIIDNDISTYVPKLKRIFNDKYEREPTLKELRQMQASAYALKYQNKQN